MYSFGILLAFLLASTLEDIINEKQVRIPFKEDPEQYASFFSLHCDGKNKYAFLLTSEANNFINARTIHSTENYGSGTRIKTDMTVPMQIRIGYGNYNTKEGAFLMFDESKVNYYPSGV